ncbi:MAG: Na(+)/H(+) antiporter NhaD [Chlamydiales bacterium]|nr:Na(+)/H(+) antiporter NhaD [Chlamydiales bacterium]
MMQNHLDCMLHLELLIFFSLGYLAIIFENFLHVNKAAVALVMGVVCWILYFADTQTGISTASMAEHVSDVAQIIFFLLAAMIIVELIDSHHGFKLITDILYTSSKRKMLWFLIGVSFFMSASLDNLTSMIVMASLLKKMVKNPKDRWMLGSVIVIAVNAGGAWTPIGDVTTTMLWINDKITTWQTIQVLFIPSVVCCLVSGIVATFLIKGDNEPVQSTFTLQMQPGARRVLFMGIAALLMIPIWKAALGLPPFMGALIGLGILWLVTDIIHYRYGEGRWHLRVVHVLTKIDTSGILFFLGILLAIDALATAGILQELATYLQQTLPNQNYVAILIGLISSVVDNVPLVAATMGMYDMQTYPIDSQLWQLIAYAAGTGGSILIIGSAAGVAFMGIEKVDFIWYMKKISWIALIGYVAGLIAFFLLSPIFY